MPTTTIEGKEILRYISDHINNYLPTIKTESPHTLKSYTIAIDQYLEWLEDIKGFTAKTINKSCFEAKMIEEWLAWLVGTKNLSKASANVKLAAVKSCVKHIAKQNPRYRYLLTEVCDVHRLKTPKRKIHGITRNAVKALFSAIDTSTKSARMYLPMFILMYGTGARIDEILSIKISDLSLSTDTPFVVLHGKGSKVRRANLLSRSVTFPELLQRTAGSTESGGGCGGIGKVEPLELAGHHVAVTLYGCDDLKIPFAQPGRNLLQQLPGNTAAILPISAGRFGICKGFTEKIAYVKLREVRCHAAFRRFLREP